MKQKSKARELLDGLFAVAELQSVKGLAVVLGAVCLVVLISLGHSLLKKHEPRVIAEYTAAKTRTDDEPYETPSRTIFVHIKGAVQSPGLYELPEDSRAADAIDAAGGFSDTADPDSVNLAEKLSDGGELYVYEKRAEAAAPRSVPSAGSGGGKAAAPPKQVKIVNINTASREELEQLPGIGSVYAGRIVDFRNENGPYARIEDVMKVKGISKGMFDQLKDYIRV
jgi:competence protein ComEA